MRHATRILVIASAWLLSIAISTCAYSTLNSLNPFEESISFGFAFAGASMAASVVALTLGGRFRWAAEVGVALACCVLFVAGGAELILRGPTTSGFVHVEQFRTLREIHSYGARKALATHTPIGLKIGAVVGVVAGLLLLVARRWPRTVAAVAVGLVIIFAAGGHEAAFRHGSDLILHWRREGGRRATSSIGTRELAAALGATVGALLAAFAAGFATWRALAEKARSIRPS